MTRSPTVEPLTYPTAGLLKDAFGATRIYSVSGVVIDLGEDLRLTDPLEGIVQLTRTNRGLYVRARMRTAIAGLCSRCLRELEIPLDVAIDEEALPSIDIVTGLPVDRSAEPDVLRLNERHELELEPVVREAIQLGEPLAPLCRADCPGLCAVCGADLATTPHQHPPEIDERWEALRAVVVDEERESE
jgi:uncharacterized protein